MKMLIFVIVLAAVTAVILWRVNKADNERELARRKAMKKRQAERHAAIDPEAHVKWPVIIRSAGKQAEEPEAELPEPTMTTIQYKPTDTAGLPH